MSVTSDFYLARAAECARDADAATLSNVQDRYRRSEAAWQAMADRLRRSESMREALAASKTADETAEEEVAG